MLPQQFTPRGGPMNSHSKPVLSLGLKRIVGSAGGAPLGGTVSAPETTESLIRYCRLQVLTRWTAEVRQSATLRAYCWAVLAGHAIVWAVFVSTGVLINVTTRVEPLC